MCGIWIFYETFQFVIACEGVVVAFVRIKEMWFRAEENLNTINMKRV